MIRYLYEADNKIYTITGDSTPQLVGDAPVTEQMFLDSGVEQFNAAHILNWDRVKVLVHTTDPAQQNFTVTTTHVWRPQIITMNQDFNCESPAKLYITSRIVGQAICKVFVSVDGGITWGTSSTSGAFTAYPLESIATNGMTPSALGNLTQSALTTLTSATKKIRVAIYIDPVNSTSNVYIDHVALNYK